MNLNFMGFNNLFTKVRFLSFNSFNIQVKSQKKYIEIGRARLFSTSKNPLKMRFVQFRCLKEGPQRLGVQLNQDGDIIDVSAVDASIPNDLVKFIEGGPTLLEKAKRIVAEGKSISNLAQVELLAPITKPDKIICVGLNYKGHCDEQKLAYPAEPFFFNKFPSTIIGPNGTIKYPNVNPLMDWEVELAVIIGRKARQIAPKTGLDYVFGYTIAQDISARDWQKGRNNGQWLLGKSMDNFCPIGPAVVAKEFFGNPGDKQISCSVNGISKQSSSTSDMIHTVDDIITYLARIFTLLPGDVILTGTPAGVGFKRNPPEFLKVGDVIVSEISGIGSLTNTVV